MSSPKAPKIEWEPTRWYEHVGMSVAVVASMVYSLVMIAVAGAFFVLVGYCLLAAFGGVAVELVSNGWGF